MSMTMTELDGFTALETGGAAQLMFSTMRNRAAPLIMRA